MGQYVIEKHVLTHGMYFLPLSIDLLIFSSSVADPRTTSANIYILVCAEFLRMTSSFLANSTLNLPMGSGVNRDNKVELSMWVAFDVSFIL